MSDMTRVALDAMGGDNAPVEMVKGAVEAVQKRNDIQVLLTGKEEILKEELAKYTYPDEKIHIVNDRNCRAAGKSNPQQERFLSCDGNETCQKR